MDWNRRQRELEERLRNVTARDEDVLQKVEKVMETQEIQKVQFEEMRNMLHTILQRTANDDSQRKLDDLSEAVTEIKKNVNGGNEEIDLIKKQQILLLKGTQAQEEVLGNFAENLEHMLNSQVDFNLRIAEIERVGEKLSNFNGMGEELHSKMDKILEKLENYSDLEKEILGLNRKIEELDIKSVRILEKLEQQDELKNDVDSLKGEMEKSQGHLGRLVESHEELKATVDVVKDTVETTLGYSEMFSEDFEGMQSKIQNMESKMDNMCLNGKSLTEMVEKLNKLQDDLNGKTDQISQSLTEVKQKTELIDLDLKEKSLEIGEFKMKTDESLTNLTTFLEMDSGMMLRCRDWECNRVLPNYLPLRKDGVSVRCPYCISPNIVGTLNEGRKWMHISGCNEYHFYQFSLSRKEGEKGKCPTCGNEGKLEDENYYIASPYDFKCFLREKENKLRAIEAALTLSSDPPLKCWQCKSILPNNLPIGKDGVSVKCPKCPSYEGYNIVGKVKEDHKWMVAHSRIDGHYQQFPCNTKHGAEVECQVCGRMCIINDAHGRVACK